MGQIFALIRDNGHNDQLFHHSSKELVFARFLITCTNTNYIRDLKSGFYKTCFGHYTFF
jgi:hypothetical protein